MILIRAIYPSFGSLVGFFSFSFQSGDRAATVWDRQNGPTRALTVAHHGDGLFVPIEIGPHVSASLAASLADKPRFQIGKPDVIGPSVRADRD
jgi:hypothetical protein